MTTGYTTVGTGTMGLGSMGRIEQALATSPPAADTSVVLFRVSIYWDGDGSPPVVYTDQPYSNLTGEEPRVLTWGEIVRQAKGVASFDRWSVSLSNVPDSVGQQVSDRWSTAAPPEGVKVVLEYRLEGTVPAWLAGVWEELFTGRVVEVPYRSATVVELVCSNELELLNDPVLAQVLAADWPDAPADSLGEHIPLVLGDVPRVEGVLVEEPAKAVLAADINDTQTTGITFKVNPGIDLSGTVRVGTEEITYTSLTVTTDGGGSPVEHELAGTVVRGANGTAAAPHLAGALLFHPGQPLTWALNTAGATAIDQVLLVDSNGNERAIPSAIGTTVSLTAPATVQLDDQPVLAALEGAGAASFLFVDLDTGDAGIPNSSNQYSAADLQAACALSEEYTETNFVTILGDSGVSEAATWYRSAPVECFPEGATVTNAWVVIEHYEAGGADSDVSNTLNGALAAGVGGTVLLNNTVAGFVLTGGRAYIGEERITYTSATDIPSPRLEGVVRDTNGVGAIDHADGAAIVQGPLEVQVRLDDGGANTVATIDGEGMIQTTPTVPPAVVECSGLTVQSKGFEDAHTHTIPGDHTHTTDTAHTHEAAAVLDWIPSQVAAREVQGLTGQTCTIPKEPGWSGLFFLSGEYGNAADGSVSSQVAFNYTAPLNFGHYYMIGTAADISPSDTRKVVKIEAAVSTSWDPLSSPGKVTLQWALSGLGICEVVQSISTTTVGGPRLNIGTNAQIGVSNQGNILSWAMNITRTPAEYDAEPNGIFTDSFELDTSALNLTVGDFVDKDQGGLTNRHCWVHWQTPNLEVHVVSFRLFVQETTGETTIDEPIDDTAWPDTNQGGALSVSSLSWFNIASKVDSPDDLIGARVRCYRNVNQGAGADVFVLRAFYVLEVSGGVVGGDEAPRRLVARVASNVGAGDGTLAPNKASTHIADLFRDADLINDASLVDTTSVAAVQASVVDGVGVVYQQQTYAQVLQQLGDGARLTPRWQGDGTLALSYRASRAMLTSASAVATFRRKDMLPTEAGPGVRRAPLSQLVTRAKVLAAPDPLADGFTVTGEATSSAAETAYGTVRNLEVQAPYVSDQVGADDLAAHVIDYNAGLAERLSWRALFGAKALTPNLGDVVRLVTPEEERDTLVLERQVVRLGRAAAGEVPYVELECVDRST